MRKIVVLGSRNNDPFEIIKELKECLEEKKILNPKIISSSTAVMLWPTPVYMHIVYIEVDDIDNKKD